MSSDDEIIYKVKVDTSTVDKDLKDTEKKIEESAKRSAAKTKQIEKETSKELKKEKKEVADHHKKQNDEVVKDDEKSGKKKLDLETALSKRINASIEDAVKKKPLLGVVHDMAGDLSGMQSAALVAGGAVVEIGGAVIKLGSAAVSSATEMDVAMNQFLAKTGKGTEETKKYQAVLEDIYRNNYGDDFNDIAEAMANVDSQLGEMSDEQLQNVTESAFALRDTFGYEIPESAKAAKAMMESFGISGDEAMNLIAAGAQSGLDNSGKMIDGISKYSEHFSKVGLDADDMFRVFETGAKAGGLTLEEMGSAITEFSGRVTDNSDTAAEGFEAIGLNAEEMGEKFAAGGETAKAAFDQTIEALAGMEDPMAQNAAGIALFGESWENMAPDVIDQLAQMSEGAYDTAGAMEGIKEAGNGDLGSSFEELQRSLELLLVPLGEALIPLLQTLAESVLPLINEVLAPLIELFGQILEPIISLICMALEPLMAIITQLIEWALIPLMEKMEFLKVVFQEVFERINTEVQSRIDEMIKIFGEIIDFINNLFAQNWKGAWDNVVAIVKTIFDAMVRNIEGAVNVLIDFINNFFEHLNNIRLPSWISELTGIDPHFSIPKIPRLKTGIDFVPGDFFPAYLDYGERVLTQQENVRFNAMGGLAGIEASLSRGSYGQEPKVILGKGCIVVQSNIDGKEAARAMGPYMDTVLGQAKEIGGRDSEYNHR